MTVGHPIAGLDLVIDAGLPTPLRDDGTVTSLRAPSPGPRQIGRFKVVCDWLPARRWSALVMAPAASGRGRSNSAGADAFEGQHVDLEDVIRMTAAVRDLRPCRGVRGN
jgi:hypothetical protein